MITYLRGGEAKTVDVVLTAEAVDVHLARLSPTSGEAPHGSRGRS